MHKLEKKKLNLEGYDLWVGKDLKEKWNKISKLIRGYGSQMESRSIQYMFAKRE